MFILLTVYMTLAVHAHVLPHTVLITFMFSFSIFFVLKVESVLLFKSVGLILIQHATPVQAVRGPCFFASIFHAADNIPSPTD